MNERSKQTYTKVADHILDTELADILLLNDEERCFVRHFLSGKTEMAACEWVKKDLNTPLNTGYAKRTKVKQYIAISIKRSNEIAKKKDSASIITVTEVIEKLATMLRNDDGTEEGRVRVKSAELLLKHMNGFAKHNESKASKTQVLINSLSDEELQDRIKALQNTILTTIPVQESQILDLTTLTADQVYTDYEEQ